MTQLLSKSITFEQFIEWYPHDGRIYELHQGIIVEMPPPSGEHEKVIAFLCRKLTVEFDRLDLPYGIPKTVFVKTPSAESAYLPDILLLNLENLSNEPLFSQKSTITQAASVPLIIEVVSHNWRDDYYYKFANYEEMGIPEYWIADFAGFGGRKFIGNPKQPTIFVCELIDGEYQMTPFQGNSCIQSPTFPELQLTAQQIFDAASNSSSS